MRWAIARRQSLQEHKQNPNTYLFFPLTFIPSYLLLANMLHKQSGCFWSSHGVYFKMLHWFPFKDIQIWVGVSLSHLNTAQWINAVNQWILYVYAKPGAHSIYYYCLLSILDYLADKWVTFGISHWHNEGWRVGMIARNSLCISYIFLWLEACLSISYPTVG